MKEFKKLSVSVKLKSGKLNNIPVQLTLSYGYKETDLITGKSDYKPVIFYTGINVDRDEWDFTNNTIKAKDKKNELESIIAEVIHTYNSLMRSKKEGEILHPEEFKHELDYRLKGETKTAIEKIRIVDFIDHVLLKSEDFGEKRKNAYKTIRNKFIEFEKDLGKQIYSTDFNETLYRRFMDKERNSDTVRKINSLWTIQRDVKAILSKINQKYDIKVFNPGKVIGKKERVKSEVADTVYFTMEQIKKILAFEPQDEKMKNIKFILLILIFTGCRESDVYKIRPEFTYSSNGMRFNYARYISQKVKKEIVVPILKPLQWIFDKYEGSSPKKIARSSFNEQVKLLAKMCKLNDYVTTTFTDVHGEKQSVTKRFYEFVSSHIGRRSFITNFINYIPIPMLTKITGHTITDNEIVYGYNKISLIENAAKFRKLLQKVVAENKEDFPFQLV